MDYARLLVAASALVVAASVLAGFMHVQTLIEHGEGEAKPPKTASKTLSTAVVTIRPGSFVEGTNPTFDPPTIKVMLGVNNTVRWVNMETEKISHDVAHEECFRNTPQCIPSFVSPLFPPGESFQYTFSAPGVYRYVCAAHPWMKGEVVVVGK